MDRNANIRRIRTGEILRNQDESKRPIYFVVYRLQFFKNTKSKLHLVMCVNQFL